MADWRDVRPWLVACALLGLAALGAAGLAVRVHLPSVPCTVPSRAESHALSHASNSVYHWAHWAELLSAAGIVVAVVGLCVSRRSIMVLCVVVLLVIALFAAGYADSAANRGCGI